MDELDQLLFEYNELRFQVYEAELRILEQQAQQHVERKLNLKEPTELSVQDKSEFENRDEDQLNKIGLALSNSTTRIIKDLYYDEEKDQMVVQLQEQGTIIELEIKNQALKRIKTQQIGKRDFLLIDKDNMNFDPILSVEDQPFSALIIPFLQKLELM